MPHNLNRPIRRPASASRRVSIRRATLAALAAFVPVATVSAADRFWITNNGGGNFTSTANWSTTAGGAGGATVPGATDNAIFTLNSTYTVLTPAAVTNSSVLINLGTVTFDLNGNSYTATSGGAALVVGNNNAATLAAPTSASLTLSNGQFLVDTVGDAILIGGVANNTGTLTLGNIAANTAARLQGGANLTVGYFGNGNFNLVNGSDAFTNVTNVGFGNLSSGNIALAGVGTSWTNTSDLNANRGTINIAGGATLRTGNLNVAASTVTVGGLGAGIGNAGDAPHTDVTGNATLNSTTGTPARLIINDGGRMNVGGQLSFGTSGEGRASVSGVGARLSMQTLSMGFGTGQLDVTAGGRVDVRGIAHIGNLGNGSGVVNVSGDGSLLTSGGLVTLGTAGTGTLNVSNNACVELAALSLSGPNATSFGTLNLDTGGTVHVLGDLTNDGAIRHFDGLLRVDGAYDAAPTDLTISGATDAALPTLELNGPGVLDWPTYVDVGGAKRGALILRGGRNALLADGTSVDVAAMPGSSGTLTIEGGTGIDPTRLITTGTVTVGDGGTGVVNLNNGGTLAVGAFALRAGGTLNLNGGVLEADDIALYVGTVNFTRGTIRFTGNGAIGDTELERWIGPARVLSAGRAIESYSTLTSNGNLTVNGGNLAGDSLVNNGSVTVNAGTLSAFNGSVTNNGSMIVGGSGRIAAPTNLDNAGTLVLGINGLSDDGGVRITANTVNNSGTLRGTGTVRARLNNNAAGKVQLVTGDRLRLGTTGVTHTNAGSISVLGGELQVTGLVVNSAGTGMISARDAILRFDDGLTNSGALAFAQGSVDVYGDVAQSAGGARITVSNGGTATFYDDVVVAPGGASVQATALGSTVSRAVFFGSYNGGLTGGGQAFIEGDHRPGNSPGLVGFGGSVSYGPFARLQAELAGPTRGTQYDAVDVTGTASLAGTLDLARLGGYDPAYLTTFNLVTAGQLIGRFDTVIGRGVTTQKFLVPLYSSTQLLVKVAMPGDANIDGSINFDDLLLLAQNYNGANKEWTQGDFDFTGTVGFDDLLALAQNYNKTVTAADAATLGEAFAADFALAQSLVPEPGMACAVLGIGSLWLNRRRAR